MTLSMALGREQARQQA